MDRLYRFAVSAKHVELEESHLFSLGESRLNDADWNLIKAELMSGSDPLFDSKLEQVPNVEAER